jgi:very-short-patch-repair endonuclease
MPFDIDARIAEWRTSLLDTTKRNRLIKFVAGRVGGVNLVSPSVADLWTRLLRDGGTLTFPWKRDLLELPREIVDAEALAADYDPKRGNLEPNAAELARELTERCLKCPKLLPTHVLTEFTDRQLAARLTRLSRTAKEAAIDHGVTTLFVVFGFLRWFEREDSQEELLAPLLLAPVRLDRETVESEYTLRLEEDDVLPNHCLAELLKAQFRIKLPTDSPLDPEVPDSLAKYFQAIAEKVKHVARWGVVETGALGVFNFQKLAMWEDLGRNAYRVKAHPLCRAIAGDSTVSLVPPEPLPTAADLDRVVSPELPVHILDADSSQHEAIEAVKRGAHLVMDGPPGTGKSQTIANMIAEALAAGKTVLFVSEKTAALDVVKRRLDRRGLGDFCLELHSHKASKKQVVAELGRCLELPPAGMPDTAARLRQLAGDRQKLNDFVTELHAVRYPFGWSAFRAHGELARLDRGSARSRIAIKDVFLKDAEYVRQGAEVLAGLADCAAVVEEPGGHPWRGCKITAFSHTARDDAEYNLGRLSDVTAPVEKAVAALVELGFATEPVTVPAWRDAEADARRVLAAPLFPADWFRADARGTAQAYIDLDEATREARDLAAQMPEFDPVAVRRITNPHSVVELTPGRERVAGAAELTVRARVATLNRIDTSLRNLALTATEAHATARTVAGLLQMSRTPTADHLADLAEVAVQIAEGPPVPLEWWDARRRAELLESFALAQEGERTVNAHRTALLTRFTPEALAPESLMFIVEAVRHSKSFWLRLWPRWKAMKRQIAAWYTTAPPTSAALRADLAELERYHRRAVSVRQIIAEYTPDIVTGPGGRPDWEASAARVRAIEWLESAGVQHTFKAAIGPRRTINRLALGDAGATLRRLATALREGWTAVVAEFAVPDAATQLSRPADELAKWFTEEAKACRLEAEALAVLVSALAHDRDVVPAFLRERTIQLRTLVEARGRIAAAARVVRDTRPLEELEEEDHSENADLAQTLLGVLNGLSRPITPGMAAALSDAKVREKVATTVRQSEIARKPFDKAWERVTTDLFDPDAEVSTNIVINKLSLAELKKWAGDRAADAARLDEWTRYAKVEKEAAAFGVEAVLDEVKAGEVKAAEAAEAFRARFFRLWLDALHQHVPTLGSFATDSHERLIARFAELDRLAVRTSADRVRSELLGKPTRPAARDGAPETSELGILLREVNKKRRHLPLRKLFAQIPSILPRIKPCLMMSPLAVSTYLDTPELTFDLVIFDEASQVRPHDAVCAVYRGRQLVVGGDPKQLPPTDFFTRTGEDTEGTPDEDAGTGSFESLLDVCLSLGMTRKRLRWHYRSRREGLIAFSNRYFYGGRLVTFPSSDEATGPAVGFVKVPDGRFKDGVNPVEARRVAELVMEHARRARDRSLGVIAFSQRQQDRILDELEVLRRQSPDTEDFFSDERDDPFFVKNLENVQGDERDVILLSVGYGPDETGKVPMRFGPLNRAGGERRLNVAVTRARRAMTVVSSMTAADIDLSRTGAEGSKLLKAFLDYAERGPQALAGVVEAGTGAADSPFEQEVGDELVRRGFSIQRQVGCGGYLIDIAITDPQRGGKYLLGVECDGATYHSAATARDRDRLRQEVLEGLGWRLVRIWSTDWVRDREKQLKRILSALEAARSAKPEPRREPEPEKVQFVRRKIPKSTEYDSIETVPDAVLSEAILAALTDWGSMQADDLVAGVSKRLGFKRTGPRIRDRVTDEVNKHVAAGRLDVADDGRVRLTKLPGR